MAVVVFAVHAFVLVCSVPLCVLTAILWVKTPSSINHHSCITII